MRLSTLVASAVLMTAAISSASEIHDAIRIGDLPTVRALLKQDAARYANSREKGESTPLHWTALYDRVDMVAPLVEAGAMLDASSINGPTALHWAVRRKRPLLAAALLDAGASVESRTDKGYTPLHWAAMDDATELATLLLSYKAKVNSTNDDGVTPLHWAVRNSAYGVMEVLILNGADIFATAKSGVTPLYWIKTPEARQRFELLLSQRGPASAPPLPVDPSVPVFRSATLDSGATYAGEWVRERMHGAGKITYADGAIYDGPCAGACGGPPRWRLRKPYAQRRQGTACGSG